MASLWQQNLIDEMTAAGAVVVPMHGTGAVSGWPDRIVVWRGWTLWIEFKAKGDRLRTNQRLALESLTRRGVAGMVAYQLGEGCKLVVVGDDDFGPQLAETGVDLLHWASLATYEYHARYAMKYSEILAKGPTATDFEVRARLEEG